MAHNDRNKYSNKSSQYRSESEPNRSLHNAKTMARTNNTKQDPDPPYCYGATTTIIRTFSTATPRRRREHINMVSNGTQFSRWHATQKIFNISIYTWYFPSRTKSRTIGLSIRCHCHWESETNEHLHRQKIGNGTNHAYKTAHRG